MNEKERRSKIGIPTPRHPRGSLTLFLRVLQLLLLSLPLRPLIESLPRPFPLEPVEDLLIGRGQGVARHDGFWSRTVESDHVALGEAGVSERGGSEAQGDVVVSVRGRGRRGVGRGRGWIGVVGDCWTSRKKGMRVEWRASKCKLSLYGKIWFEMRKRRRKSEGREDKP